MPDPLEEPLAAARWLLPRLTTALTTAKILPVKLTSLKHQEVLRSSSVRCFVFMVDDREPKKRR